MALGQVPGMQADFGGRVDSRPRVNLISEFQLLVDGRQISLAHGVQRLIAFLAMSVRPVSRSRVAGELWMDVPEGRALGNLRSALWRLRRIRWPIVKGIDDQLTLDAEVEVDLAELTSLMREVMDRPDASVLARLSRLVDATDVLPGWEDEWIVVERERFRELRLHALERASEALLAARQVPAAVQAALAAVGSEPFRDSAQRLLVRAYLEQGNHAAALRTFRSFRDLLATELGIEPSDAMSQLVADIHSHRQSVDGAVTRG